MLFPRVLYLNEFEQAQHLRYRYGTHTTQRGAARRGVEKRFICSLMRILNASSGSCNFVCSSGPETGRRTEALSRCRESRAQRQGQQQRVKSRGRRDFHLSPRSSTIRRFASPTYTRTTNNKHRTEDSSERRCKFNSKHELHELTIRFHRYRAKSNRYGWKASGSKQAFRS